MRRIPLNSTRGFSLLELVAVVTLIGIVAAVTMYRLAGIDKSTAAKNAAIASCRNLQVGIERYRHDLGEWPTNATTLTTSGYASAVRLEKMEANGYTLEYDAVTGLMKVKELKTSSYVYP